MSNYWNKVAPFYNFSRRGEKQAYEQMYALIRKAIQGKDVLEIATGTGIIAFHTAECARTYLATDYAEDMLCIAQNDLAQRSQQSPKTKVVVAPLSNLTFAQADAHNLPYSDNSFDVVIIANALHIMPEPEKAIAEIKRVLRPNGLLIAPTYVHGENTFRQRLKAHLMSFTGFREYAHWTETTYHDWLRSQGITLTHTELINASFPLAYTEGKITQQ